MFGHHLIFGAYGFWLPNDPRGSWSKFVGSYELYLAGGKATTTDAVESVAHNEHDIEHRRSAKLALLRPAVQFSLNQVQAIGCGLAEYVEKSSVILLACAILPDHLHFVVAPHRLTIDKLAVQFKGSATRQLLKEKLHPFQHVDGKTPKCFAQREWNVELESERQLENAINYVEQNPVKAGLLKQIWPFVKTSL